MTLLPTKYFENAISLDIVEQLKDYYYSQSADSYDTDVMKKINNPHLDSVVYNLLAEVPDIDVDRIKVSNFYNHKTPYLPHTDFRNDVNENFVIPVETVNGQDASLVIFDQWWPLPSNTWVFHTNATFEYNKELKGRPCDYDVENMIDGDIDDNLYNEHLYYFPKKYWKGLSGKAYKLKPGNLLEFDSKMIHATSAMNCERKLGLTLRYR